MTAPALERPIGALPPKAAALYIGDVCERHLFALPIRRTNIASPGSQKPRWVFRVLDLDAFLASRGVDPPGA